MYLFTIYQMITKANLKLQARLDSQQTAHLRLSVQYSGAYQIQWVWIDAVDVWETECQHLRRVELNDAVSNQAINLDNRRCLVINRDRVRGVDNIAGLARRTI